MTSLSAFWQHYQLQLPATIHTQPAALVCGEDKTSYTLNIQDRQITGRLTGSFKFNQPDSLTWPKVGDWVTLNHISSPAIPAILQVLPRINTFTRSESKGGKTQILATNIDWVMIIAGLDNNFNPGRINQYVLLARQNNLKPIIILNKADKHHNPEEAVNSVLQVAPEVPIHLISALTKSGLDSLAPYQKPGHVLAFCGDSGAGKSTLINALLDNHTQKTQEVNKVDHTGKHTTTRRSLIITPHNYAIIDMPGISSIELPAQGLKNHTTATLTQLVGECKYTNCDHIKSSGCAVKDALTKGLVTEKEYKLFLHTLRATNIRPQYKHK